MPQCLIMILNSDIHEIARLRIVALLASLDFEEKIGFSSIKASLNLSDGNLSSHIRVLEDEDYIKVEKTFVGRKPKTYYRLSIRGREAFAEYIEALQALLSGNTKVRCH